MEYLYVWQPPIYQGKGGNLLKKTIRMVKIVTVLMCLGMVSVHADTYSQNVNVNIKNGSLVDLFEEIQEQSNLVFLYRDNLVADKTINVSARNENVQRLLRKVLGSENLDYVISGNQITIMT